MYTTLITRRLRIERVRESQFLTVLVFKLKSKKHVQMKIECVKTCVKFSFSETISLEDQKNWVPF